MSRRRCRNCPQDKHGLPPPPAPRKNYSSPDTPKGPGEVIKTYEGESEILWSQVTLGCSSLVELLFNYVAWDVPGEPLPALKRLHQRLGEVITIREERISEANRTPQ